MNTLATTRTHKPEQTIGEKILTELSHMGLCPGFGEIHVEAVDAIVEADRPTPTSIDAQVRQQLGQTLLRVMRDEPNAAIVTAAMKYLSWDGKNDTTPGGDDMPSWAKGVIRNQKLGSPEPADDE